MSIEAYIRQAAIARGMNPDVAVRVAKSEGGLTDPVRQSDFVKNGQREPSYGPFQLYMGGGLGNKALEAGIDPRDPNQWQRGVDFALDNAKKSGWGQWYGAARAGIGNSEGIGGVTDGPKGQEVYTPAPDMGTTAGILGGPAGGILGDVPQHVADYATSPDNEHSPLQKLFAGLAQYPDAPTPRLPQMGDARSSGDALLKFVQSLKRG